MLHQFLNRLHGDVFAELERLDYLACLCQHVRLDHPLVGALSVPFFTHRDGVELVVLFGAVELVGQVLNPVFLRKLLVSFLSFVDLHSSEFGVLTSLLYLVNFLLPNGVQLGLLSV